jgi:hypothetical protein
MKQYPYAFHVALDGNGINGLEGMAGVCLFLFDPADNSYAYKIKYYNGMAGGHAVSVNPTRRFGFLGNAGQHLMFYDAHTSEELDRISTLRFQPVDTTIRGSTHVVWTGEFEFITAIGDYLYRFDLRNLGRGEKLGPHKVKLPHAMRLVPSGRYIVYGSMDNPRQRARGEAKEVGVFDVRSGQAARIDLPATCWHLTTHRTRDLVYAVSFRVQPQDYVDYQDWAIAFLKEYAFEIDPEQQTVLRHWACSRDTPAHINSDLTISDSELIFCNGASQTIVFIDLATFAEYRLIDERPTLGETWTKKRQVATQVYDVLARGGLFTSTRHLLAGLRVSRFSLVDSIHACQLSLDQSLLFTANRGLNHITVYNYPANDIRLRVPMPDLHEFLPLPKIADPRLGLHHGYLVTHGGGCPDESASPVTLQPREPKRFAEP